jgi:hypothetical protein
VFPVSTGRIEALHWLSNSRRENNIDYFLFVLGYSRLRVAVRVSNVTLVLVRTTQHVSIKTLSYRHCAGTGTAPRKETKGQSSSSTRISFGVVTDEQHLYEYLTQHYNLP